MCNLEQRCTICVLIYSKRHAVISSLFKKKKKNLVTNRPVSGFPFTGSKAVELLPSPVTATTLFYCCYIVKQPEGIFGLGLRALPPRAYPCSCVPGSNSAFVNDAG